jgi:hypothetical protein
MIFTSVLSKIEKSFHEKYDLSSTIRHKGERGRQRENGLLLFLKENLPEAYGVATGEIVPFRGEEVSPQCDVIIYDKLHMPILGRGAAVQQVPLEAVYGVIECKSLIDAKALKDARAKFDKIRSLPRCASRNKLKKGMRRGPFFDLFGYRLKARVQSCIKFMESAQDDEEIGIASLDSGIGIWVGDKKSARAVWLESTAPERSVYETLALYYVGLLESLRQIDLGNPSYLEMLFTSD